MRWIVAFGIPLLGLLLPLWSRSRALAALAFFLIAFPKAGVKPGDVPFPIMLGVVVLFVSLRLLRWRERLSPMLTAGAVVVAASFVTSLLVWGDRSTGEVAFTSYWVISALLLATLISAVEPGDLTSKDSALLYRAAAVGTAVVLVIGVAQYVLGLDALRVDGLTIAYGDSYAAKPLFFEGGMKIPSTYQNGNLLGAVFSCLVWYFILHRSARGRWWFVTAALALVLLSGSRTALLALAVTTLIFLIARFRAATLVGAACLIAVSYVALIRVAPALASRYGFDSLFRSGGSGRSVQWAFWWQNLDLSSLVLGDSSWRSLTPGTPVSNHSLVEGLPGMVQQVGLLGLATLSTFGARALRSLRSSGCVYVLLPAFIASLIDSSYAGFPVLWTAGLCAAALAAAPRSDTPDETEERRSTGSAGRSIEGRRVVAS
jgi:hypothetical protein